MKSLIIIMLLLGPIVLMAQHLEVEGDAAIEGKLTLSEDFGNAIIRAGGFCFSPSFGGIGFNSSLNCSNYSLLSNGTNTILNAPGSGRLYFETNTTTRLMIDNEGKIGIGTTSPDRELVIHRSDGGPSLKMSSDVDDGLELLLGVNQSSGGWLRTLSDHDLSFWTNGQRRMSVKNTGEVGIGVGTPQANLHIKSNATQVLLGEAGCSSGTFAGLGFGTNLNCSNYSLAGNGAHTVVNAPLGGQVAVRVDNKNKMVVTENGIAMGFGAGTYEPEDELEVVGKVKIDGVLEVDHRIKLVPKEGPGLPPCNVTSEGTLVYHLETHKLKVCSINLFGSFSWIDLH